MFEYFQFSIKDKIDEKILFELFHHLHKSGFRYNFYKNSRYRLSFGNGKIGIFDEEASLFDTFDEEFFTAFCQLVSISDFAEISLDFQNRSDNNLRLKIMYGTYPNKGRIFEIEKPSASFSSLSQSTKDMYIEILKIASNYISPILATIEVETYEDILLGLKEGSFPPVYSICFLGKLIVSGMSSDLISKLKHEAYQYVPIGEGIFVQFNKDLDDLLYPYFLSEDFLRAFKLNYVFPV